MENIERKSIAFDPKQLEDFDKKIEKDGYNSRSEALRDLIRDYLLEKKVEDKNANSMGTLTFVYDHHSKDVRYNLTKLQHDYNIVKTSIHVHVDHHNCMEVLILEGKVGLIEELSKHIISIKGVKNGKLTLTGVVK